MCSVQIFLPFYYQDIINTVLSLPMPKVRDYPKGSFHSRTPGGRIIASGQFAVNSQLQE